MANKENCNRATSRTSVMRQKITTHNNEPRDPLKTLSNHNRGDNCLAGPSYATAAEKALDTRFVTLRCNHYEDVKQNLAALKENCRKLANEKQEKLRNYNKAAVSNRNANSKESDINKGVAELKRKSDGEVNSKYIPIKENEINIQINVPKKKANSQNVSETEQDNTISPASAKSCGLYTYLHELTEANLETEETVDPLNKVYLADNLEYLLKTEKKVMGEPKIRKASRSCIINWIINVNGSNGNPDIVQLASWYLDCYLTTASVTINRLQVIAAACFWIAAKFHGRQISGRRLVKYSGHAFIEKELISAERHILRKLKFQAVPVIPHDFVPYLAWCCDQSKSGLVESAAVFLCQCGIMMEKSLAEEYPSVIAVAAVKSALVLLKLQSWMDQLKACSIYRAAAAKTNDLNSICIVLRDAVRTVSSVGYEYKAPIFKYSGPPHYVSNKIVRAVGYCNILDKENKNHKISI